MSGQVYTNAVADTLTNNDTLKNVNLLSALVFRGDWDRTGSKHQLAGSEAEQPRVPVTRPGGLCWPVLPGQCGLWDDR